MMNLRTAEIPATLVFLLGAAACGGSAPGQAQEAGGSRPPATSDERPATNDIGTGLLCPECGSQLVFAEGCLICRSCAYTKCG